MQKPNDGYKLVALDIDGTLLNSKLEITEKVGQAIQRARATGVRVTLATGRMYVAALPFAQELNIDVPLVTYQGALIKTITGEVHSHKPVNLELAREVISRIKAHGYHINVYLDDKLYVAEETQLGRDYAAMARTRLYPVGDLLKFLDRPPTKVLAIAEEKLLDELALELKPHFGERLHISKSKPHFLEFSHPQATKAHALEHLAGLYGITRGEMLAVGDSYNDLEMLEYAGLGVVLGNARDEVKAWGDYIAPSNDEDGVAHVIDKFILGGC